ncbi:MAG TPA: hypothetical protein VHE61_04765 [Opitutaceae bacterium]|nr:hypothetical protein [Opitutaceae bacterium]
MNPVLSRALLACCVLATARAEESKLVHPGPDGRLVYQPYDAAGDTILDFSNCGYRGGGVALPRVATKLTVAPSASGGDDTARLQQAVDRLGALPLGADGFRGALLLEKGTYRISGSIKVGASGIVIRGQGSGPNDTVLLATGTAKRSLIEVRGAARPHAIAATRRKIAAAYVPVGARTFAVEDAAAFRVGETVFLVRHGNAAWIHTIGMDRITPRPSNPASTKQWHPFDLSFDRVITAIDGDRVTVDAPLACAIDERWGGGELVRYEDRGRTENVGVENLRGDSEFDPGVTQVEKPRAGGGRYLADENHALRLVSFDNVKNAWVRNVVAVHFYQGVSDIGAGAKWVTVQDSSSLDPVSIITGGRRYPFAIEGQLNLVQRCYSRDDRHAFVFGARVPGPNAFVLCVSEHNHATSEPHHRWSCGGLYDDVHAEIAFQDRQWMGSGHGWAGANYVAWNTEGLLICEQPPTAQNFAIGFIGRRNPGVFPRPQGYWESQGRHVHPPSLYLKQLEDRCGPSALAAIGYSAADIATLTR